MEDNQSKLQRELRKLNSSYNPMESYTWEYMVKEEMRDGNAIINGNTIFLLIQIEDKEMSEHVIEEMHNTALASDVSSSVTFDGELCMK